MGQSAIPLGAAATKADAACRNDGFKGSSDEQSSLPETLILELRCSEDSMATEAQSSAMQRAKI
eukprot:8092042-Pyramimonas_sp.AAC.1